MLEVEEQERESHEAAEWRAVILAQAPRKVPQEYKALMVPLDAASGLAFGEYLAHGVIMQEGGIVSSCLIKREKRKGAEQVRVNYHFSGRSPSPRRSLVDPTSHPRGVADRVNKVLELCHLPRKSAEKEATHIDNGQETCNALL